MRHPSIRLTVLAALFVSAVCFAEALPRSTPEAEGVSSAAIFDFIDAADKQVADMHSFMMVRHGKVIAEGWWSPYAADVPHVLFSLSKSFTSTAVGLAAADGKLSVDDEVYEFFPNESPAEPSNNLKAMRVKDLLTMTTGQHAAPVNLIRLGRDRDLVKAFLAAEVEHKPGTFFMYNTAATYMQSAIVQKVTGQTVLDYLKPRLFDPLGIDNPKWGMSQDGVTLGGYGLNVRTEDIAKFGQLYLQKGKWNGKQLIAPEWIDAATSKQVSNGSQPTSDWDQGYGYQFWRCRHGFYRGDGAFGQFCIVMPQHDVVIAITAGTRDMGLVMNLIWEKLLPGIKSSTFAPDESAHAQLKEKLASLTIPLPVGKPTSPRTPPGPARLYVMNENDQHIQSIALECGDQSETLVINAGGREHRIACDRGRWRMGRMQLAGALDQTIVDAGDQPVAAAGAWMDDQTYAAKLCFYETPMILNILLRFDGNELTADVEYNVSFGPTTRPTLIGRAP